MVAIPSPKAPHATPVHVAIVMDGNGRWARAHGLPRTAGHYRGAETVRRIVEASADLGIRYLTLFGFSSENWKRPTAEVSDLMGLLRRYLSREISELHRQNVRFRVIGDRSRLGPELEKLIEGAEATTALNTRLTLIMALSYGGRAELVEATRALATKVAEGTLDPSNIDEAMIQSTLWTHDIPDPDLFIRTSGEQRISNFLLWQLAYAELVFTDTLWPDFDKNDLIAAITEFHGRERRYGA